MKAFILEQAGSAENLRLFDIPKPIWQSEEVLIQVKAIGINPVTIKLRREEQQVKLF